MTLRTQVAPFLLVGDSMADLPDPASVAQGYLFHEEATGQARVLVIDPVTQVRTWEPFGSGAAGPAGPSGATGSSGAPGQTGAPGPAQPVLYGSIAALPPPEAVRAGTLFIATDRGEALVSDGLLAWARAADAVAEDDVLIYVDNVAGDDANPGTANAPLATADAAFAALPPAWRGRAEVIFAVTGVPYAVTTNKLGFGFRLGPGASALVLRGGYTNEIGTVVASGADASGNTIPFAGSPATDSLLGAVAMRLTGAGSPAGRAVSIRGNTSGVGIDLQVDGAAAGVGMGAVAAGDTFQVQRPAVTLAPTLYWLLAAPDGANFNVTFVGIKIAAAAVAGADLVFDGVRAQFDTGEIALNGRIAEVFVAGRLEGGLLFPDAAPGLDGQRRGAGLYVNNTVATAPLTVGATAILGGHLTFRTCQVSMLTHSTFFVSSLEALASPFVFAGHYSRPVPGWGSATNRARIRNVAGATGDGLAVLGGGIIVGGALNLEINGCGRHGIRVDTDGYVSWTSGVHTRAGQPNGVTAAGFGLDARNGTKALVGADVNTSPAGFIPLAGTAAAANAQAALTDVAIAGGWATVVGAPQSDARHTVVATRVP